MVELLGGSNITNVVKIECENNTVLKAENDPISFKCKFTQHFLDRDGELYERTIIKNIPKPSITPSLLNSIDYDLSNKNVYCTIKHYTNETYTNCYSLAKNITMADLFRIETHGKAISQGKDTVGFINWKKNFRLPEEPVGFPPDFFEREEPKPKPKTKAELIREEFDLWKFLERKGAKQEKLDEVTTRIRKLKGL